MILNLNAASRGTLFSTALVTQLNFQISTAATTDTINVTAPAAGGASSIYNAIIVVIRTS
jgi:hypothetical protein